VKYGIKDISPNMSSKKGEKVRVSITIREDVYEHVKELSHNLGIKPSAWITMAVTSQVNGMKLSVDRGRESE
jgi:phage terminase small subunit